MVMRSRYSLLHSGPVVLTIRVKGKMANTVNNSKVWISLVGEDGEWTEKETGVEHTMRDKQTVTKPPLVETPLSNKETTEPLHVSQG
jgi:hypothetical protein